MEFLQIPWSVLLQFNNTVSIVIFIAVFTLIFDFMKRRKLSKKCGDIYSLQIGWGNVVVINGFKATKEILIKKSEDCADRPVIPLIEVLGYTNNREGVVLAHYGRSWKEQRRFTLSTLRNFGLGKKSLEDRIIEEARFVCNEFQTKKGQPFDAHFIINNAVSNVICSIIFGQRFDYEDKKFLELLHLFEENLKVLSGVWAEMLNIIPWAAHLPGPHQQIFKVQRKMKEFLLAYIKQHKDTWDPSEKRDFIDAFITEMEKVKDDPGSSFNEENLMHTTLDVFIAGTETTSTTLRWALLFMLIYPAIQSKVQEEIDRVVGKNRSPKLDDRMNMPFTDAVIHEVQRYGDILPIGPPRKTIRDIDVMGFFLPKGTTILPNLSSVLKDETVWEKPLEFYPEHFLDNNGKFVKREAFLPFSAGHRICLGEQLARTELFIFFTTMMQQFTFHIPDSEPKPSTDSCFMSTLAPTPFKICAKLR
ncbi:cytochrome P450 2D10-like isoform X2 [Protopterus annectens]|uniref:cytochrome P450 2D10-like isoform X2 n=1 Tax=Protopterus annectens TaxID=7888 RepID=UPI001CFB71C8|nr:cytochrome P450 2D10-like isoform X2 [Protopterus annectens]